MSDFATAEVALPVQVRRLAREGRLRGPTAGMADGYAQTNVVILPAVLADEFAAFCAANAQACPLLIRTAPGDFEPRDVAPGADLRTDVPRYRVFRDGVLQRDEPTDIRDLWRDDLVGFLLGCSFTFERALAAAGLSPRHVLEHRNVAMYRTSIDCAPAGRFAGPLVVSMRPYPNETVDRVRAITAAFPTMHGAPVHVGDPTTIGIASVAQPDFGEAVEIRDDELPVFWACGVTSQLAVEAARADLAITHSPGCMFVIDRTDESFRADER